MRRCLFPSMLIAASLFLSASYSQVSGSVFDVNYRALVSRADLSYDKPVERSEEGMPVGNGRMGSLVWTTPTALRLQINRVDVFASNCATNSFPSRHSDYCGGCGFVDIDFVDYGPDVFTKESTSQHLSCYDGLVTVEGRAVTAQVLTWHEQDVMAIQVSDKRERPAPISINLRMLRPPVVRTRSHTATSKLVSRNGRITLTQAFKEGDYYCGSAVAIGIVGRNNKTKKANEQELQLIAEPGKGLYTIFIASAASFDPNDDVTASALSQLEEAKGRGYTDMVESNRRWWHDFWAKSFVHLQSADGVAEDIEANYTYYLYVMASSSRGKYPTKFNGMLWTTGGDMRQWGAQYWGANQSCLYNALFPTNRLELLDPMFNMYTSMYDACAMAARQQWDSKGIFIPETLPFDGLEELPADIAAEMQDLYLLRKPWEGRSERFCNYVSTKQPHSSRWNWIANEKWEDGQWRFTDKGAGCYGHVTHIFSRGAKIAYQYWLRYEYTMDKAWLRDRAYPMLKDVTEFYSNYPNVRKDSDGKYHIYHINSNESVLGGRDTDEEIASIMGILPVVIKASEILEIDSDMRPLWREFMNNLAPLPTSDHPDAPESKRTVNGPTWIRALPPVVRGGGGGRPDGNTMPIWFFDLCTLENNDPETIRIAGATYDAYFRNGVSADTRIGVLSKVGVTAAMMGRADHVRYLLPNQINTKETPILANRMDLREGRQTTSIQRLGRAADTLHNALCQSVPAGPGREPVIRVFPAWPREWDATFMLLTRGAFLVGSTMEKGEIGFIHIQSQVGGECRLRNPWPNRTVTLYRNTNKAEDLSGAMISFPTVKDETIVVVPKNTEPTRIKILL